MILYEVLTSYRSILIRSGNNHSSVSVGPHRDLKP